MTNRNRNERYPLPVLSLQKQQRRQRPLQPQPQPQHPPLQPQHPPPQPQHPPPQPTPTTTTATPTTTTSPRTTEYGTLTTITTTTTGTSTTIDTTIVTTTPNTTTVEFSTETQSLTSTQSSTPSTTTISQTTTFVPSTTYSTQASTTTGSTAQSTTTPGASTTSLGTTRTSTPLTSSADTTTVSQEPPTTTPYIPKRRFPPVVENRYRINYWATCNHYWQFTSDKKIIDQGAASTFVREQVIKRRMFFNDMCGNSSSATASSVDDKCCVACADEDLTTNVKDFKVTDNITNALNGELSFAVNLDTGLDATDSMAVKSVGTIDTCITLGKIASDAPYGQVCLQEPERCDYGLSASVWVNFTFDTFIKEVLLSTLKPNGQGFQFYVELGKLTVLVVGAKGRWIASIDGFEMKVGKWRLLGFTWERSTGIIQIYIDSDVRTFFYANTYTEPNAQGPAATDITMGCELATSGTRSYLKANIIHPALWFWPIQQENLILLTGALVYKLIKYQAPVTTPVPTTPPTPSFAYSSILREARLDASEPNPYYKMADYYLRGYDAQGNVSVANNNITVTEELSRNGTGFAAFRFVNSPAKFTINGFYSVCLGNNNSCTNGGISMSLWIAAFRQLPVNFVEVLRFNVFSLAVCNGSGGDVTLRVQAGARYIDTKFKFQKWTNVGFIYDWRGTVPTLTGYVNGINIGSTSADSGSPLDSYLGMVTIGSDNAPVGFMLNDFTVWYRPLEDFEAHRFLGYTRDQLRYIRESTFYWTTDEFVLADGLALSDTRNYNLKSQFRYFASGSALKSEPDRHNKSAATRLDSNWFGQIFLGNEFSKTPTEKSIMWYGKCITDPFQRECQISGLSMHMWINVKSVDPIKKQFFFCSGDLGDARSSTLDSRGISLFTTGNLLGASLSTDRNDWAIVIDSNRYNLNEWFNIGFTWREQEGMRLFLNGTDYGIKNLHPDVSYKAYDKHTRAVVGRFDDDQNSTWRSNSEWVMGNFSYSDVVFYNRWMSPEEFSRSIGSVNNRYYARADLVVFGQDIIDTDFLLMKQASLYKVPIGPMGSISSQSEYAQINTNGEIGIKAYAASECPRNLSSCAFQVLFSTWIQVLSKANDTVLPVLSLGNENTATEGFGLSIASDRTLIAWVRRAGNGYKMVTQSVVKVRFGRWLNLGLMLSKNNFFPTIFLNGTNVSSILTFVADNMTAANTAPGALKLGLRSSAASSSEAFLAYVVSGWYGANLLKNQMNQMLGVQSNQYDLMGLSDEYWTVSGLWNKLQPRTLLGVNVQYSADKFDMENGAMCTAGSGGSYISLGNLQDSCLQNTAPCKAFILTVNFKPKMPTSPGRQFILSTGGQNPGHMGTAISVTSDGYLFTTVRSFNKTCEAMVPFNYSDWIQLQVRWYSEASIAVKVDEETISSRAGANSTCWSELNDNSTYSEGHLGKVNNNITNAFTACFSDVMFMYQLLGSTGTLDATVGPANCYTQQTTYVSLISPGQVNYAGKPNSSRLFNQQEAVDIGSDACFFTTAGCEKGVALSFWLKVNTLSVDTEVEIMNTGYGAAQGVVVKIVKDGTSGFRVLADASFMGRLRRIEGTSGQDQVAFSTWVNIGLSVTSDVIELYQNGIRVRASTRFDSSNLRVATGTTVSIGSSSAQIVASDLVIWNEPPLNCLNPDKNRKMLTGDCSDSTIRLSSTCMPDNASSCLSSIENNMCLDPKFNNVVLIDRSGQLFSSQPEANTASGVIYNTATDKGVRSDFIQSSLNILSRISANLVVANAIDNDTMKSTIGEFSKAVSAVLNPNFAGDFRNLVKSGTVNPAALFTSVENLATRMARNIKTDCSPVVLTEGRMHWSTQKIAAGCSSKDNNRLGYYDVTRRSWSKAKDAVYIPDFLASMPSTVNFLMACVVYDGVENLIASTATNETTYSNVTNSSIDLTVNSRVVSMWLSLPITVKPVNFTLTLRDPNKKRKDGVLKYETRCAFWNPSNNLWSTEGCYKDSEDEDSVNCRCDHMTSFAILMQPVPPVEDNIHARILSIMTYILLILSLICLLIFIIVIACSKRLRGERYVIHLNLAGALFVAQFAFLFTHLARDNADFCKAIAIIMHLFFVASFAMLFIESLWVFYAVTKGIIRGKLKWWLPVAWLIPVLIVGVVGGINSSVYGGPYCWITGIYIWSFLGPLVAFGCLSLLVCLIVVCNLSEPAIKRKDILNDLRNHTHQCAFLIPLMILAWLFGILLVQWYNIPIEYFFVIFNASQGIWVFLCFGHMNPDFREVICLRRSRSSVASSSVSITGVQDINSSKTSFETGSQVAIVPQSASPKRKGKKPPMPQEPHKEPVKQQQQQQQQQPSAPVYYTGKPRKQPQPSADEEETTNSRARLQPGSARSLRSGANLETDADRPGTPRTEKFTPPGTVE